MAAEKSIATVRDLDRIKKVYNPLVDCFVSIMPSTNFYRCYEAVHNKA